MRTRRATIAVASSPSVEVVENPSRRADPLVDRSPADLLSLLQSTYTDPGDLTETGAETDEHDRLTDLLTAIDS